MVTTTADLSVIHVNGGVRITYDSDRKDAYEGKFDLYKHEYEGFVPMSVRGVASAYAYMNDDAFEIMLIPVVREYSDSASPKGLNSPRTMSEALEIWK